MTFCHELKLEAVDGKRYATDCANTEGIFRIIQSIPSPKAEPFKRWLARVGYERVKEIEDPELATKRTRTLYKLKGYNEAWIDKRLRGINIREELTDEWQKREIKKQRKSAILTAEISKAKDAQGFIENQTVAKAGGKIAGDARKNLELASVRKVTTKNNYLNKPQNKKLK